MAYYQGDYYQGDYYAGDPFLGSLIGMGAKWLGKKIFKRGAKMAGPGTALVPGRVTNVMTQVGRGAGRIIGRGAGLVATGAAFGAGERMMMPPPPGMFSPPGRGVPYRSGGREFMGPPAPTMLGGQVCCPSGFHMAKDGSGRCVRNRSMNVANPRALRRSLRRVAGFGKLAQRSKKDIRRAAKAIGA